GGAPHEEDTWKEISIGGLQFTGTRQCVRCSLPTVDQDTGIPGKEPIRTLSTYRKTGNKVMFGMNLIGPTYGELRVGDEIEGLVSENIPCNYCLRASGCTLVPRHDISLLQGSPHRFRRYVVCRPVLSAAPDGSHYRSARQAG